MDSDVDTRTASQLSETFSAFSQFIRIVFLHTQIWCIEIRFPFCCRHLQVAANAHWQCSNIPQSPKFMMPESCVCAHSPPITISSVYTIWHIRSLSNVLRLKGQRVHGANVHFRRFWNDANARTQLWVIYPVRNTYIFYGISFGMPSSV